MEPARPQFEETIAALVNSEAPLLNAKLIKLSNLSSTELETFKHFWTAIEPKRRRQIVSRLVEMTEDNIELNFDRIFRHCLKDLDDEVQCRAIEGLWENEESPLINPLIDLLEDDSEKVQTVAAIALGKFVLLAEYKKLSSSYTTKIQEALLKTINDTNKTLEVRRRTLEAIAPLSLPQVKETIMEAYHSPNARLRVSSIYAMGKNGDSFWSPILLNELANVDAEMRYEAAIACGELEKVAAEPHLIQLINDAVIDVRLVAIQTLGKIGGTKTKEILKQCLSNPNEAIRQAAEQVLNDLKIKEDPLFSQS